MLTYFKRHFPAIIFLWCFSWLWIGGIQDGFVGHPGGDLADHIWGNEWFAASLHRGEWPFWVRENYFPETKVLWHIDPLGGLFRAIFWYIPVGWAWNIYLIFSLYFSSMMLYCFACWLHGDRLGALIVALMLQSSAFTAGLIHSGLAEYLNMGWGIGLLWFLCRERWYTAGLFLGICGYQSFSYGLIGGVITFLFCWKQRSQLWKVYLLSFMLIVPMLWAGLHSFLHEAAAFSMEQAPGWSYRVLPAVDLLGWIRIGDWVHPDTPSMGNPGILQVHYIGWVLLIVCSWSLVRSTDARRWGRRIVTVLIASLGPRLSINRVVPFDGTFFLPLALLYVPFSPFQMVHHPYRITAFSLPLLLLLAGYGLRRLRPIAQILILVLYIAEQTQSSVPYPFLRAHIEENVGLEGARLDWPPDASEPNRQYMLAQLKHKYPIAYGVNMWMPDTVRQDPSVQRWIRLLDDPRSRSKNRDMPVLPDHMIFSDEPFDAPSRLKELGFEWLVVHRRYLSEAEQERLFPELEKEFGAPLMTSKTQWVFSVDYVKDVF